MQKYKILKNDAKMLQNRKEKLTGHKKIIENHRQGGPQLQDADKDRADAKTKRERSEEQFRHN